MTTNEEHRHSPVEEAEIDAEEISDEELSRSDRTQTPDFTAREELKALTGKKEKKPAEFIMAPLAREPPQVQEGGPPVDLSSSRVGAHRIDGPDVPRPDAPIAATLIPETMPRDDPQLLTVEANIAIKSILTIRSIAMIILAIWVVTIGLATHLTSVELRGNHLIGTIPTEIGLLTRLTWLTLSENQLNGTIPTELGMLTNWKGMYLEQNQLTRTIPTKLGQLTKLTWLHLGNNALIGTIPTELGQLSTLTRLYLYNNTLIGSIPEEICQNNLQYLRLSHNNLIGSADIVNDSDCHIVIDGGNIDCSECAKLSCS